MMDPPEDEGGEGNPDENSSQEPPPPSLTPPWTSAGGSNDLPPLFGALGEYHGRHVDFFELSSHHNEGRFGMRPQQEEPQPHLHAGSFSDRASHNNEGHFAMPYQAASQPYHPAEAGMDYNDSSNYNNTGFQYAPNHNLSHPENPHETAGVRPYTEEGADEGYESMDRKPPPRKPGEAPSFPLQESTHRPSRKPPPVASAPNTARRSTRQTTKKTAPRKNTQSPVKRSRSIPPSRQSPRKVRKVAPADRASGGPAVRRAPTRTQDPRTQPLVEQAMEPPEEELAKCGTIRASKALTSWYERLRDLHKFKALYGHVNVPQKYPANTKLGVWVNKQRMEKKAFEEGNHSKMTERKIKILEGVGFNWAKRKGETAWEMRYRELNEYMEQYGNCCVPTKFKNNKALGRWVSTQRAMHKRYMDFINDETEESLEDDPEQSLLDQQEECRNTEGHSLGAADETITENETEQSLVVPEEAADPEHSCEQGVSLGPEERIEIERRINLLEELGFIWRMIPSPPPPPPPPPSDSSSTESREATE